MRRRASLRPGLIVVILAGASVASCGPATVVRLPPAPSNAPAAVAVPPREPDDADGLVVSTPEAEGMDSRPLLALADAVRDQDFPALSIPPRRQRGGLRMSRSLVRNDLRAARAHRA